MHWASATKLYARHAERRTSNGGAPVLLNSAPVSRISRPVSRSSATKTCGTGRPVPHVVAYSKSIDQTPLKSSQRVGNISGSPGESVSTAGDRGDLLQR